MRTEEEVEEVRIPNAINHDFFRGAEFIEALKQLDPSKNYYVYCRSGGRSGQACMLMNQLGIENTFNLVGGIQEWKGDVEQG